MTEEVVKSLIRSRGTIKQKLTNVERFIDTIKTSSPTNKPSLLEVELRLTNFQIIFGEFNKIQSDLELQCKEENLDAHYNERVSFEERYYTCLTFLKEYIQNLMPSVSNISSNINNSTPDSSLQNIFLPKIKLPTFNGNFEQWLNFKVNFQSTIDKNKCLSDFQKYQFLRASLEGYALKLIENIEGDNQYVVAWQVLSEKFDKKQFLINTHINAIINMSTVYKESHFHFQQLLDETSTHLNALDGMKLSKDVLWDSIIIYIVSHKLDKNTEKEWRTLKYKSDVPNLEEFTNFLKERADILQSVSDYRPRQSIQVKPTHFAHNSRSSNQVHTAINDQNQVNYKCSFCSGNHSIYRCEGFLSLPINQRLEKVRGLKLCENCLRSSGHTKDQCQLSSCRKCRFKHNTLLHRDNNHKSNHSNQARSIHTSSIQENTSQTQLQNISGNSENSQSVLNTLVTPNVSYSNEIPALLSTVIFQVQDQGGQFHQCRALLDSGAQSNLITEKFCNRINLKLIQANTNIVGINQVSSPLTKKCTIKVKSNHNNFECSISCFVVPIISSNLPSNHLFIEHWNIPPGIILSDPQFYESREVDMLIGANLFWDILIEGKIKIGKNLPIIQNTLFGWTISGNIPNNSNQSICNFIKIHIPEDDQLKRFWELEEVSMSNNLSIDEIACEKQFEENTYRDQEGRFVVKFPLKYSPSLLGTSHESAIKRFLSLERKFSNEKFRSMYCDFMHEYMQLNHMSQITTELDSKPISYTLPHHGVLKESSLTTKLRIVFDGSCQSSSGWSLNNLQYTGPKLQNDIFDILVRFRSYQYVVSADVSKMYRQILIHPEHRPLQLILWRESSNQEFKTFMLNTVTYGTKSAPYLAIKCIHELAKEFQEKYPVASKIILNDIYVDDLLTGSNDLDELKTICSNIFHILSSAHFILRKWVSNDNQALPDSIPTDVSNAVLSFGENEHCKTLGIQWLINCDSLKYKISEFQYDTRITKRTILSIISQIYDPLGLLTPCIILFKIFIQKLWSLKISWDDPIPNEMQSKWNIFQSSLLQLNHVTIPRYVVGNYFALKEIHCFCDASRDAYAASIYTRSFDELGNYNINLLCSKSKVSPLKTISIPRLELCASLLGSHLVTRVKTSLALDSTIPIFLWSDSQVALNWIRTEPSRLQVFVANRVSQIQSLTSIDQWRYINTKQNPADIASRGVTPEKLINSTLWWNGPEFLLKPSKEWPSSSFIQLNEVPELKRIPQIFTNNSYECINIFSKFSKLQKLQRVVAYCCRFVANCKLKRSNRVLSSIIDVSSLTVVEINNSNLMLIKLAQRDSFSDIITHLQSNKALGPKHNLSSLAPFIDNIGVIRVAGRLRSTSLDFNIKHPVLLSSKHSFTQLIFEHKHVVLLHPGPQLLLSAVRQYYWAIGGRNLAKKVTKECVTCFKFNPKFSTCPMAGLPDNRIKPSLPFEHTGIDYAGPFFILNKQGRGAILTKCYLCVFVCFCTKSIHLEAITNMTTESFLAGLRRFTSRRGIPSNIYSDNGSTFIGARNELRELGQFLHKNQKTFLDWSCTINIKWHFIPPYSPNFGGLWESAVKSAKHHLKRILINNNVTYEEFNTLIIQVEGILNSRPLLMLSDDPHDYNPLTPSHFLTGRILTSLPDVDLTEIKTYRLTRLQHVQQLYQQFWTRFSKDYVTQLHSQYKWKVPSSKLGKGSIVLIKNDNLPPCRWSLGRVEELFPGSDGVSRVASIKTSSGIIKRSVRHLCPLPRQEDIDN